MSELLLQEFKETDLKELSGIKHSILKAVDSIIINSRSHKIRVKLPQRILSADLLEYIGRIGFINSVIIELVPVIPNWKVSNSTYGIFLLEEILERDPNVSQSASFELGPQTLVIHGHGDGAHIKSGKYIYCGAFPRNFHDCLPRNSHSCDYENKSCVKEREGCETIYMYDLHPNSLILLSCNSISIASEATDRCENIATAALASGCESIIGFTRQIDFRPGIIRVLAGPQKCSTAAELIQALNSVLDFDSDGVAVCLGLTSHQFSTMKAMPYLNSNPVCSSHFPENPLKLVDVNNFHNELTRFIDINEMLKLICKKFALNNLISLIDLDTALILKARLFTHAISIKMAASESVSRNTSERYFRSQKILSEHFSDLCRGGLLSEIDTGAGVGDRLIPALRESRSRTLLSDFSICPQCAGIRRTWSLESLISSDTRFEAECSACGLHFNVPARSSINPGIQCDRMISIGDFLVIKLSILGMTREMQLNTSAYVQIRNKAEDEYLLNDSFTLLTLTSVGLSVKIPIGAKSDLHSIRIAWRNSQGTFLLRRLFITQSVNGESDD